MEDAVFKGVTYFFALSIIALVSLIFLVLLKESWMSIRTFGVGFLFSSAWDPVKQDLGRSRPSTALSSLRS